MGDMAKILRCAAKALESLEAANRKRRDTKATRAPVKKNIVHRTLTKTITEKEITKPSQAKPTDGPGLRRTISLEPQDTSQVPRLRQEEPGRH